MKVAVGLFLLPQLLCLDLFFEQIPPPVLNQQHRTSQVTHFGFLLALFRWLERQKGVQAHFWDGLFLRLGKFVLKIYKLLLRFQLFNPLIFLLDALGLALAIVQLLRVSLGGKSSPELLLLLAQGIHWLWNHPLGLHSSLRLWSYPLSFGHEFLLPAQGPVLFQQIHLNVQILGLFLLILLLESFFLNFLRGKFPLGFFALFRMCIRVLLLMRTFGSPVLPFSVLRVQVFLLSVLLVALLVLLLFQGPVELPFQQFLQVLLLDLVLGLWHEVFLGLDLRGRSNLDFLGKSGVVFDDFGLLFAFEEGLLAARVFEIPLLTLGGLQ